MRPPRKRGTAIVPVEQRQTNVFKISLRIWQSEYKARQSTREPGDAMEEKTLAQTRQN